MKSRKPIVILLAGILCTGLLFTALSYLERKNAKAEFNFEAERIHQLITEKLTAYEEVLIGVKAFFMASQDVSLQEWEIYFDKFDLEKIFPGLQGIGYVQRVKSDSDYQMLRTRLASYGMENFTIKPAGEREEYYPVVFLDPLDDRNRKAIGYDIYSEEIRRNAIESAKNNESTSITRKITLVQEDEKDVQGGLLMMVPYFTNERIGKQDEPRELDGIIDGVIRMGDFTRELIDSTVFNKFRLRIYDLDTSSEDNLLFDSCEKGAVKMLNDMFHREITTDIYDQQWILKFEGQPTANFLPLFFGEKRKQINLAVLVVGCLLSGLGAYTMRSFETTTRLRKEKAASALAKKSDMDIIRRQEEALLKFKDHSDYLVVCIVDIENSTRITANLSESATAKLYSAFDNTMSEIVLSRGGTIVKSMGDAVMYYFHASSPPSKDECLQAVLCCLDILSAKRDLNKNISNRELAEINYRVSAVYGSVMSASKNGVQDIFGPTVNQCSKINRLAKTNGLVVSEQIYQLIKDDATFKTEKIQETNHAEHGNGVYHLTFDSISA